MKEKREGKQEGGRTMREKGMKSRETEGRRDREGRREKGGQFR